MQRTTYNLRRLNPWLRGALVLYLLGTVCLVAVHQHHGLQTDNCALCTICHTPATVASAVAHQAAPTTTEYVLAIPGDQRWESESRSTLRSRAPPLA